MKPAYLILRTSHHCFQILLFQRSSLKACPKFLKTDHQIVNKHHMSVTSFSTMKSPSEVMADEILCRCLPDHMEESFRTELITSLNHLFTSGVKKKDIEKYQDVLRTHSSYIKILYLLNIKKNPTTLLSLLILPPATLSLAAKQSQYDKTIIKGFEDRVSYLQHHLELNDDEFVNLVLKHPLFLTLSFAKLDIRMQILKYAKISVKDIVKDAWIFYYTEKLLSQRTEIARCKGIALKPWHLRCSKKYFNVWLSKMEKTQNILQGEDPFGYLAKRLNCSKDYVNHMFEKNVFLSSINVPKLEKVLDFLFEKGYTPEEIRLFPKVFCCSIATLEKRFEEFKRIKKTMPTVPQISLQSNFNSVLKCTAPYLLST